MPAKPCFAGIFARGRCGVSGKQRRAARSHVRARPQDKGKKLGDYTIDGFGEGTSLLGMPGDFTPPSHFVRAAIFSYGVLPSETADDAVLSAFHVLNNFDIARGVARDGKRGAEGNIEADDTQWTGLSDLANRRDFVRTYDNSAIRTIGFEGQDLDAPGITTWQLDTGEPFVNLAAQWGPPHARMAGSPSAMPP
ncbi:linear amide C-N hydrolase [Gymnodinialimonas sp.]